MLYGVWDGGAGWWCDNNGVVFTTTHEVLAAVQAEACNIAMFGGTCDWQARLLMKGASDPAEPAAEVIRVFARCFGNPMWLDSLTDDQVRVLRHDIFPRLMTYLFETRKEPL